MSSPQRDPVNISAALDSALASLLHQAAEAAQRAYSPYSGFKVGAALQLDNGSVVTAANVENVSYGLTICAERAALARAVAEHGPEFRIVAVAVTNLNEAPSPPCGACRQMLAEFVVPNAPVIFRDDQEIRTIPFKTLLPHAFETRVK